MDLTDLTEEQRAFLKTFLNIEALHSEFRDVLSADEEAAADMRDALSEAEEADLGMSDALSVEDERAALQAKIQTATGSIREIAAVSRTQAVKLAEQLAVVNGLIDTDLIQAGIEFAKLETAISAAEAIPAPPELPADAPPQTQPAPPPSADALQARRETLLLDLGTIADTIIALNARGVPSGLEQMNRLTEAFSAVVQTDKLDRAEEILSALKKFVAAQAARMPVEAPFDRAMEVIATGAPPDPARHNKAEGIATKYPGASNAAKGVLDGFAAVLGDTAVTPQLLTEANQAITTCQAERESASQRAEAIKARIARDGESPEVLAALQGAEDDLQRADIRVSQAQSYEKAARGKLALEGALNLGILSPNSSKALDDDAAQALIESFARNPELASKTAELTTSVIDPNAMARGLPSVISAQETGFAALSGATLPEARRDVYAEQLVQMGGNVGPEYFERLDAYLMSGRHLVPDPTGELMIDATITQEFALKATAAGRPVDEGARDKAIVSARAQKRTSVLGGALITDGHLDLTSPEATGTIGDLLFSPNALRNPQPAMNAHMLETVGFLSDPDNARAANDILDDMPDTVEGGSGRLVRRALGKGRTDPVTKQDAQQATMASMLKSFDQGPVGSCFSTAPLRRMRVEDPLATMKAYADVAGTGKFKPDGGPEVPVVTQITAHEDPIMRSLEYSLATSMARQEKSNNTRRHKEHSQAPARLLANKVTEIKVDAARADGGIKGKIKASKEKVSGMAAPGKLRKEIAEAFTFTYDSTAVIKLSNDGSSNSGRYVITEKSTGNPITSEAEYKAAIARVAIDFAGVEDASAEADEIRALVATPQFSDSIAPVLGTKKVDGVDVEIKYEPWALDSGGGSASNTLYGEKKKLSPVVKPASSGNAEDDGKRSVELVEMVIQGMARIDDDMVEIGTVGQHLFNAQPNHPSLAPLKASSKKGRETAIQTHLIDAAADLKTKAIPMVAAQKMYDDRIAEQRAKISARPAWVALLDRDAPLHRPAADATTKEISDAVKAGTKASMDAVISVNSDNQVICERIAADLDAALSKDAMQNLDAPEFFIADTNWGTAESHTYFIVAPDPLTGEPKTFQKTVPPGTLRPLGRDWTDNQWKKLN
ncbi:MAG: hypothetical protein ABJF86_16825 [Tateyamaria sp.]|uniref:hypothetical protein n=1 Tax=Tateyamaria sp. TaxID=1929288 RepID=UPI00328BC9BB